MSLLIPKEIRQDINSHSGYISVSSKFGQKNLKGLFYTDENQSYLVKELSILLTNEAYVKDTAESLHIKTQPPLFKPYLNDLATRIRVLMEAWPLPHREDTLPGNPVMALSNLNKDFIINTSKTLIMSPDSLILNYYDKDPTYGNVDAPEYDYGAASYSDGTWHPEHLFKQSKGNRANPYWKPLTVSFDTNPPPAKRGAAFHARNPNRYPIPENFDSGPDDLLNGSYPYHGKDIISTTYHSETDKYAPGPGPGNKYRYDHWGDGGFTTGGTFPRWQTSVNNRQYQRDNQESLREGGLSDRRVQRPSGYDMSTLLSKSTL
jgi:hypothetical protein